MNYKLWGGRFSEQTDKYAHEFNSSIAYDKRLYSHDIKGSIAYAKMLGKQGIIEKNDADNIAVKLGEIFSDIENDRLKINGDAEDIHSFIESELVSRIGEAGKRLHTGRSRNEQVSLDMRMYVMDEIDEIHRLLFALLNSLLESAKKHLTVIMPGFTHMQKAQPITLAHHLMAYFQMFRRDSDRLADCRKRTDYMPLGSGALASTSFPIDREFLKEELGFAEITQNSMDAVSDRDFCIEFNSCLSLIMMHLSRFCEELILWTSGAFNFMAISDSYSTGSSIMPQKKNPDMAELIRGKSGRVFGNLTALLTMMKGLPLSYNKDMQEDKEAVFDSADTVKSCLAIFTGMFNSLEYKTENMLKSCMDAYINATDAADYLVKKGLPFRDAHEITGKLVLYAIKKNVQLDELDIEELRAVSPVFNEDFFEAVSIEKCVEDRNLTGGPSADAIGLAIQEAQGYLENGLR